ncbi:MAG TPA: hypothetical protein GX707_21195 [Epulopiscium sp.]|nr:hypothetical protein [Candidatus Epulonipiscium sp.]
MIKKMRLLVIPMLISVLIVGGCTQKVDTAELEMQLIEKDKNIEELFLGSKELIAEKVALEKQVEQLEKNLTELEAPLSPNRRGPSPNVLATSMEVIQLIKDKSMTDLSEYIHPSKGVRMTPYFHIDMQNDQVFTALEVATLDQNVTLFNWGNEDGSGEPINLNFNDYYNQFIYDEDFVSPHLIGNNTSIGSGNTLDNVSTVYPNGHFIEFHFTGIDAQYAGIDWRSLKLVFEKDGGLWYLVGIVHGQWTV